MDFLTEILNKRGLKYEDLTTDERSYYDSWMEKLEKSEVSISDIREYIKSMRMSVDNELAEHELSKDKDLFLKARLRNYILLEAFLSRADMARKQLEKLTKG